MGLLVEIDLHCVLSSSLVFAGVRWLFAGVRWCSLVFAGCPFVVRWCSLVFAEWASIAPFG
jgi:hypothetical protein